MFPTILLALLSLALNSIPYVAVGQVTTTAVCTTDTWTTNDRGQSPCLVTSALQAACDGGNFEVPALEPGQVYFGPQLGFGNPCTCSTVTYSMAMACGACQGAGINKWSTWMTNCTPSEVSLGFFPLAIPSSVTIPAWAYQNVTTHDLWDANEALATANEHQPDSSAVPQPTGQNGPNNPSTGTKSDTSKSSINIGAIAGGVAGGVVLILSIVAIIFFLRRRRNQKSPTGNTTSVYTQPWTPNEQEKFLQSSNNASPDYPDSPPLPTTVPVSTVQAVPQQFKAYDPSDPSTFPATPMFSHGTAHDQSQPSGSVRSFQMHTSMPSMSALSYNSSNPNIAPYSASSTRVSAAVPTSYQAPTTRSGHTYTTNQGHPHAQPAVLDPSQYVVSNAPYSQVPYSQQRGSGGYTGAAEI